MGQKASPEYLAAKAAAEAAWLGFEPYIAAYREGRITADEYLAAREPVYRADERVRALAKNK